MKRVLVVSVLAFLFWSAVPAFANSVPSIAIACDSVTVAWTSFPDHPVDLNVTVAQGDEQTVASVSTEGARDGSAVVPVQLGDGEASASVSWTLRKEHTVGPVTADLHCSTTTSTTSTTEPPTTTSLLLVTTTSGSSVPPPPPQCGPDTLACTGSSSTAPILFGLGLIGAGAAFMALNRRGSR